MTFWLHEIPEILQKLLMSPISGSVFRVHYCRSGSRAWGAVEVNLVRAAYIQAEKSAIQYTVGALVITRGFPGIL